MGAGSLLLGYGDAEVEAAIQTQLKSGTLFSMPHTLEVDLAQRLTVQIPCAERVAFGKNGSDVCGAAVRIARTVTGREGILQFGYHGFHDWCAALNPAAEGVPESLRSLVYPIPYNDLDGLNAILAENGERIAGIIMEPLRSAMPEPGFLAGVKRAAKEHGVVLIFDEMVTGFRLGPGGAQELFGVTPDLACIGKALSNGLSLSALVGSAELMQHTPRIAYGMTGRGESLAMAAATAALAVHQSASVAQHVEGIGQALRAGFAAACQQQGVDAHLVGHPAMQGFVLPEGWEAPFYSACRQRGVFTNGYLLPSLAHDEESVRSSCEVFAESLAACSQADLGD